MITARSATARKAAAWLRPDAPRRPGIALTLVAVGSTYLLATNISRAVLALGVVAVVAAAILLQKRPLLGAALATIVIAVVPIYWARVLRGAVATVPVTVAAIALLPAAWAYRDRYRRVAIDLAFVLYMAVTMLSTFLNYRVGAGSATSTLARLVLPYAVFRLLATDRRVRRALASGFVVAGTALAVLGIVQRARPNVFYTLVTPGYQAATWAHPKLRFGKLRLETSFGHPIAFATFLAAAIILCLGLSTTVRSRFVPVLYGAAGLMGVALVDTLSRGPLLIVVIGILLWLLLTLRRVGFRRFVVALLAIGILVSVGPIASVARQLQHSVSGRSEAAKSASYRVTLLTLLSDPHQFSLLGKRGEFHSQDPADNVTTVTGLYSIDNEFARIYVTSGVVPFAAFIVLGVALWWRALRPGDDPFDRAWTVSTAVVFIGLVAVALLTQEADLWWIGVATVASISRGDVQEPVTAPAVTST